MLVRAKSKAVSWSNIVYKQCPKFTLLGDWYGLGATTFLDLRIQMLGKPYFAKFYAQMFNFIITL